MKRGKRNPYHCQLYGYKSQLPCGKPAIMSYVWPRLQLKVTPWKVLEGRYGIGPRPILLCEKCWIAVNRGTGAYLPYDRGEGKQ